MTRRRRRLSVSHRRVGARSDRAISSGERGETLIELLITIVLMGLVIVALIGTLLTVIVASNAHRRRVRSGIEATTVVENIQNATYVPCATGADYESARASAFAGASPGNYQASIISIRYLVSNTTNPPTWTSTSCTDDKGLQEITVKLESPKQTYVSEQIVFVKRDDRLDK